MSNESNEGTKVKKILWRLLRNIFHSLPLDSNRKNLIASVLFGYFPFLFGRLPSFQRWKRREISLENISPWNTLLNVPKNALSPRMINLPTSLSPRVSVIIPVYGKVEYSLKCLHSISRCLTQELFEVIVVDDCSPDNTLETLKSVRGVRVISNQENLGFIRSCNAGAAVALGEYLCFLNNDTEVCVGWLDELIRTFDDFPGTGLAGSKLVYPNGVLQEAGGVIWRDGSAWNFGRGKDPCDPIFNYAREVDYISGASILIKTSLFKELEGFDEFYLPAYCEDADLALKVRNLGLKVMYQPLSVVVHYEGITSGTDLEQGVKSFQVVNLRKLFERWEKLLALNEPAGGDVDKAKDRGSKYRVLVLDECIPTPDNDAGSLLAVNLLLLQRQMGFQVTFISVSNFGYDPSYTRDLQRAGIEVLYAPFCTSVEQHIKKFGKRYDLIFVFRPMVAKNNLNIIRQYCPQAKILFHTVDLHYLRMTREANLLNDMVKQKAADEMKKIEFSVIREVDASIVVSTTEQEILRQELPRASIHVFPLIMEIYGHNKDFVDRRDIVFVGGYQHQPNIDAVQFFVSEVMPILRGILQGVHFYIVGSKPTDVIKALAAEDVHVVGYVKDINPLLDRMRISVAPLRYGAGIKGKIGTAMAAGLPTVATSLAAEGMSLTHGENVLVVDGAKKIAEAIAQLYQDEVLWNELSRKGLEYAEKTWGSEKAWSTLHEILQSIGIPTVRNESPLILYSSNNAAKFSPESIQNNKRLMPVGVCSTKDELQRLILSDPIINISALEKDFIEQAKDMVSFTVEGFCVPCNERVYLLVDICSGGRKNDDHWIPNWRERLECPICKMNNRQRLIATLVNQHLSGINISAAKVYFMEQVTPIYLWAKKAFAGCQIIGSEYLGYEYIGGAVIKGIRHEDVMELSFDNDSIDLIVSNDVFEHVPIPAKAFSECWRVLRPRGVMLATIPFHSNMDISITRSTLSNGEVKHLLPPMYHGNPLSAGGSLVFTDFGWDMIKSIYSAGFLEVMVEVYASEKLGHLGGGQLVFRAVK